ncbi:MULTISPECIES: ABC transporter permease [unclassified Sphingomonas]|uniref:ABC transporter permease n=2 Tax=Sphingomonas TaxID=13687 RepID=UPI000681393B|nr:MULTISPECIES: ABC transporter permease [unclassified Sphingomonas]KTF68909.1 ABC transporter [Sphingomonas sp. WG]
MGPVIASGRGGGSLLRGLSVQGRVIGAIIMRELHTRYGRDNIGYLWLFAEPMILASVMALLHRSGHTEYGSDIKPLAFTVLGYTTFIMFRQIVNRSEGIVESSAVLLYHRMVTIFDVVLARSILEAAGTFTTYILLSALLWGVGLMALPARPLYLFLAIVAMFWCSWSQSMIIASTTHDNRTLERLVHPYAYFMIPISCAFIQVSWIPEPYRTVVLYFPLPHIFELARYGQFNSAKLDYFDGGYLIAVCAIQTWLGLVFISRCRKRLHLR